MASSAEMEGGSDGTCLRPRRPSALHHADHITDVALDLFASRGFDEVSVDDIAQAAGIARRTLFRYYSSKNAIPWGTSTRTRPCATCSTRSRRRARQRGTALGAVGVQQLRRSRDGTAPPAHAADPRDRRASGAPMTMYAGGAPSSPATWPAGSGSSRPTWYRRPPPDHAGRRALGLRALARRRSSPPAGRARAGARARQRVRHRQRRTGRPLTPAICARAPR